MEEWKNIEGFDGYQVSNEGRVKSLNYRQTKQEKILKSGKAGHGYLQVQLCKNGKPVRKYIHRLVAEAFIENPNNCKEVNHKDEDKTNNHVENLEWCNRSYNNNYGTGNQRRAVKQSKCVDQIDPKTREVIHQWESTRECGRNGYDQGGVSACARGLYKQYKGYIWKYIRM